MATPEQMAELRSYMATLPQQQGQQPQAQQEQGGGLLDMLSGLFGETKTDEEKRRLRNQMLASKMWQGGFAPGQAGLQRDLLAGSGQGVADDAALRQILGMQ